MAPQPAARAACRSVRWSPTRTLRGEVEGQGVRRPAQHPRLGLAAVAAGPGVVGRCSTAAMSPRRPGWRSPSPRGSPPGWRGEVPVGDPGLVGHHHHRVARPVQGGDRLHRPGEEAEGEPTRGRRSRPGSR